MKLIVVAPELKGLANAMNGVMLNIGGIIGNTTISFLIQISFRDK